jgi:hypothetical protein
MLQDLLYVLRLHADLYNTIKRRGGEGERREEKRKGKGREEKRRGEKS